MDRQLEQDMAAFEAVMNARTAASGGLARPVGLGEPYGGGAAAGYGGGAPPGAPGGPPGIGVGMKRDAPWQADGPKCVWPRAAAARDVGGRHALACA